MRPDDGIEDLLRDWGEAAGEDGRDAADPDAEVLRRGLRIQAGRRLRRRALVAALVALLVTGAFFGGRASVTGASRGAATSATGGDTPGEETPALDALGLEMHAYTERGPSRREAYGRAAAAWLEQEGDVLASLRCLEHVMEEGEPPPADDPLWDNWLWVALQGDAH